MRYPSKRTEGLTRSQGTSNLNLYPKEQTI